MSKRNQNFIYSNQSMISINHYSRNAYSFISSIKFVGLFSIESLISKYQSQPSSCLFLFSDALFNFDTLLLIQFFYSCLFSMVKIKIYKIKHLVIHKTFTPLFTNSIQLHVIRLFVFSKW